MKIQKRLRTMFVTSAVLASVLLMSGCSAMNTAIKKKDLDVQTKMSETVFLEPVAPEQKIVFIDIRNTSDKDINITEQVKSAFIARGYTITQNPNKATYMLQGNILKIGKSDLRETQGLLGSGFGGGIAGAAVGATAGYALTGSSNTGLALGLAGAAAGFIGDALVEDVLYVMVTDLQIRERPLEGEVVTQTQQANLQQGTSTQVRQNIKGGKIEWKTYRTRIVSTANKMNLKFEEAQPVLESALAHSVSGIF
jgi:hypothetical protein